MAIERINPFLREDRFCLDHLLRYLWVRGVCAQKRVLDVACGTGFGSAILSHGNAKAVIGVDKSAETIETCREAWSLPNLTFEAGTFEALPKANFEPFEVIISFETLEHLSDPQGAVGICKDLLCRDGLFVGSVPGELDALEENEYHLQSFNRPELESMLRSVFRQVKIYRQSFAVSSRIAGESAGESGEVLRHQADASMHVLDFGRSPGACDTYLFLASDAPLPDMETVTGLSRQAWAEHFFESARAYRELGRISAKYQKLFSQHGDLQRRFSNVLAWGQYQHALAQGGEADQHYLRKIELSTSQREEKLRETVEVLQRELELVRADLAQLRAMKGGESSGAMGGDPLRRAFLDCLTKPGRSS